MKDSAFNPQQQQIDISSKIVAGLERISEVFKIMLWEKAKVTGLSPIQIQILIFIAFHKRTLCNVSHLAREFNVTKPTISDAVRVLDRKEYVIKDYTSSDSRSFSLLLSESGNQVVKQIYDFANPLKEQVDKLSEPELDELFGTISKLIYKLNRSGVLSVQRTCYGCIHYNKIEQSDFCNLLGTELLNNDIRLDCPEFEASLAVQ